MSAKMVPAIIILAGLAAVAVVAALPKKAEVLTVVPPLPVNVQVEQIVPVEVFADTFELEGKVEPDMVIKVSAEVPGRIERYGPYSGPDPDRKGQQLDDGDFIRASEPLMYLNTELLDAAYKQAKASYEKDLRDLDRFKEAMSKGVATQKELDTAQASLELSQATLQQVKAQLDRTTIFAPVSGIINNLTMKVGEYVQPGTSCAEIVNNDTVKVVVNIPEQDIRYFKVGQGQEIMGRFDGVVVFRGQITYIGEVADPLTLTTRLEISVPNQDRKLYSGQIVAVKMKRQDLHNVVLIPLDAVIPLEDGYMVYVVQDGKAQPVENIRIDLQSIRGKRVRVLSGLSGGEILVLAPGNRMCGPGQAVRIIDQPAELQGELLTIQDGGPKK